MLRIVSLASALLLIAITPVAVRSFAEGPFPGFTGGFKEPTCQQCHFGHDLNEPGGKVSIAGVPGQYESGKAYDLTVVLEKAGLEKGGFQLAAREAGGPNPGRDAGTLEAPGADVQLVKSADNTVTYVQHTPAGTKAVTPGTLRWKIRWTAPKTAGPAVSFDLAANASNNDESPMDDAIYTAATVAKPK